MTCDSPNCDTERSDSNPGSPPIAISIGNVTCRSTSSGTSAWATVLICTCTGVVSGKASRFRELRLKYPATQTSAAPSRTIHR